MPSLVPGYSYDIFVSYRHKDNKYDGWVSEFVTNLRKEMEATFKEDVSIYFDENPHDGLLETHNVDKSLEGKLKCLIFIPIISQTYCDLKSFAWQHEFCAFNKLVKENQFGRDIKLSNGNVASRILPVKIHDLDAADNALLENELGGVLRAIEFIFKSPGVNRPLTSNDRREDNSNKTFYRDQVNKVANAIKEIITSLQNPVIPITKNHQPTTLPVRNRKTLIAAISFLLFLSVTGYFLYSKLFSSGKEELLDRSIAVLPFIDMSPGHDQEYFSDGLSEELINILARIPKIKVIGRTSSFSFKGKDEDLRLIGQKLGVAHLLEGSVRKWENNIRVKAQLVDVDDGSYVWSQTFDRPMDDIFKIQDEIANAVAAQLKLVLIKGSTNEILNKEAYNLYLQGKYFYSLRNKDSMPKALELFEQALAIDSSNARIWAALAVSYVSFEGEGEIDSKEAFRKAQIAAKKSIQICDQCADGHSALGYIKRTYEWDWAGAEKELNMALQLEPGNVQTLREMAHLANSLGKQDMAIQLFRMTIELDPVTVSGYYTLAFSYWCHHKPHEALAWLRKVEAMNPQRIFLHLTIGLTHLELNQTDSAILEMQKETNDEFRVFGLACAYHHAGRHAESDAALKELIEKYGKTMAYQIAEVYGYRGEADKTFEWLEISYSQLDGGLNWIKINPLFDDRIRSDKRFNAFLKKMNLPV